MVSVFSTQTVALPEAIVLDEFNYPWPSREPSPTLVDILTDVHSAAIYRSSIRANLSASSGRRRYWSHRQTMSAYQVWTCRWYTPYPSLGRMAPTVRGNLALTAFLVGSGELEAMQSKLRCFLQAPDQWRSLTRVTWGHQHR